MLQSSSIYFPDVGKQVPFSVALVVRWRDASFWKPSSLLINHLQQQNSQRLGPNYTSTFTQGCTSKPQKRTTKWRCGIDFVFHRVAIWFNLRFFDLCVYVSWHGSLFTGWNIHDIATHTDIYIYTYLNLYIYIHIYMVTYRIRFQALALQLHFASFESLDSDECWFWKIILLKSNSCSRPPTTIKFWSFFPP